MDIKYLTQLNNNPNLRSNFSSFVRTLEPLSMDQITTLETAYNHGTPFPTVLRELLFIAGQHCYLLDYGDNDTQEELQEWVRDENLFEDNNKEILRPFFVIDVYGGSQFLFVYLDEGKDDPQVYAATSYSGTPGEATWIRSLNTTLSAFINQRLIRALSGASLF